MRALVLAVLICGIVALLLVAGCTFNLKNADGSLNKSFSTNFSMGSGTTKDTTTVTSTGSSLVPDDKNMKVYFTVGCSRSLTVDSSDSITTTTTILKGDVPVMVPRNWNKEPKIRSPQDYGSGPYGGEAKLDLHSELIVICKKPDCKPCHWVYNGPAGVGVSVHHDPKDASADWTAALNVIGTPTTDSVSTGALDQYTANLEPACGITDLHGETMSLYYESVPCLDVEHESMITKPFTFSEGSKIIYTSSDPEETFDSIAVFHFSDG